MLEAPKRRSRRFRLLVAVSVFAAFALALAANASAIVFTASISPTSATAGSTSTYQLRVTDLGLVPLMGSVNVQIPAGWSNVVPGTPQVFRLNGTPSSKSWTASVASGVLRLRAQGTGNSNKLELGQSLRLSLSAKARCSAGTSTWTTAARNTLDFSPGITFFILGPQPKVTVSGTCVDHLVFVQQPTQTAQGDTITPAVTVRAEDASNNVVSGFGGQVTMAIGTNPSGGTLGPTPTATAVNGVATFSALSIDAAGDGYTLVASSGSLQATSTPFDVTFAQSTVPQAPPGTDTSGSTCSDANSTNMSCAFVDLPNGGGPLNIFSSTPPTSGTPVPFTTFTTIEGNFKGPLGETLYDQNTPAFANIEVDSSLLDCAPILLRATHAAVSTHGASCEPVVPELWAQFDGFDGGNYFQVPLCGVGEGGPFFPEFGEGVYPICITDQFIQEDGDAEIDTMFFQDPRLATH
jgi:hypothetical protein